MSYDALSPTQQHQLIQQLIYQQHQLLTQQHIQQIEQRLQELLQQHKQLLSVVEHLTQALANNNTLLETAHQRIQDATAARVQAERDLADHLAPMFQSAGSSRNGDAGANGFDFGDVDEG